MPHDLFMGIDIGTSSVRAALFDREGNQLAISQREYPLICTEPDMAEIEPDTVLDSLLDSVRDALAQPGLETAALRAIGISTAVHSILAVDADDRPLTRVLTWADSRPIRQAEQLEREHDCAALYRSTGCRVQHPMYPLSKILWLKQERPDIFRQATRFVSIKAYVLHRLFGRYLIDYADASASSCFNIHQYRWDPVILEKVLGIGPERLAEPVDGTAILQGMDPAYARRMGIRADIPVCVGSGDGMLANLGCGVFDHTAMTCTVGTSGAMRITVDRPLLDPEQRTWCFCLIRGQWVAGGAINNGGIILRWLRDSFRETFRAEADRRNCPNIYALFDEVAAEIPAGCNGLTFLPLLTGERSPYWNARARGVLYGLDLRHDARHIVRAAMEGIVYRLYSIDEALRSLDSQPRQIRANGGYAASDIWLQIQADVFGRPIAVSGVSEAAALGAAYLAMFATGAISRLDQGLPAMRATRILEPNPANAAVYREGYQAFCDLYDKLYR